MEFTKTIRGYSYTFDQDKLNIVLWLETFWGEYCPLPLTSIQNLECGNYICKVCNNFIDTLEAGYCMECFSLDEMHQVWLRCLYNRRDSYINTVGCVRSDPSCGIPEHVPKCYRRYLIYLGRVGSRLKVGITAKGRNGGFWGRFLEQGLNEAIVVDSLANLPEASKTETMFRSMKFNDAIRSMDKAEQLLNSSKPLDIRKMALSFEENGQTLSLFEHGLYSSTLLEDFPLSLWEELFPDTKIQHVNVFPDTGFEHSSLSEHAIKGEAIWFQGSLVISEKNNNRYYTNLDDLLHREIITLRRK